MERGIRESARDAMKRIFEAASYNVMRAGDPLDLSATRDGTVLLVLCSDDPETIRRFDSLNYHLHTVDGDNVACRKLLFSLDPEVQVEDCILWGVDEFVHYAGRAALAEVLGQTLDLNLDLEEPAETTPVPEKKPERGPELLHLPVQVAEERACGIAGMQGTAKCRFIPYWSYHYVSTGEREVKDRVVSFEDEGSGALNAINGMKMEFDPEKVELGAVPLDSEIMPPRMEREDVEGQLVRDIIDRLTQRVRFRYEKGDAIFYEEKTLKPGRNNISVDLNMIYVPVWQVRGRSRIVEVNAFTGEILSMPMDEGVELL
jgi:hypothetical protein